MARFDNEVRVVPSVLDRLVDYEPEITQEPPASRSKSLRLLKQSVRRDLEWLLNTRQLPDEVPESLAETAKSALVFGLPDFTNSNIKKPSDEQRLRRALEWAIRTYEPRLEKVVVSTDETAREARAIRFRIEAQLRVDPAPEPVAFDTTLELGIGQFQVKGD